MSVPKAVGSASWAVAFGVYLLVCAACGTKSDATKVRFVDEGRGDANALRDGGNARGGDSGADAGRDAAVPSYDSSVRIDSLPRRFGQ